MENSSGKHLLPEEFFVPKSSDRRFFEQNVFSQKIFEGKRLLAEDI